MEQHSSGRQSTMRTALLLAAAAAGALRTAAGTTCDYYRTVPGKYYGPLCHVCFGLGGGWGACHLPNANQCERQCKSMPPPAYGKGLYGYDCTPHWCCCQFGPFKDTRRPSSSSPSPPTTTTHVGPCDYRSADGRRCYRRGDTAGRWPVHDEAVRLCRGGTLPVVDSKQVGRRLDDIMPENGEDRMWIDGGTRTGRPSKDKRDWVFADGTPIPHGLWSAATGEPNDDVHPELCVMWKRGAGIEDWSCNAFGSTFVLCEPLRPLCDYRSTDGRLCYALADTGGQRVPVLHGEAVRLCADAGGTLPVVDSKAAGERLDDIMAENGVDRMWVDGSTRTGRGSKDKDDWVFTDGTPIPHGLWSAATHEPDDDVHPELCVMWKRGKGMEDWSCNTFGGTVVLCQRG